MSRLASYIVFGVLKGTALVVLALVAVASVIELVGQLEDVGLAEYGLREALTYVSLRIPHKMFEVLPAAALLGALLYLGNMAVHRELVVMRASGVSHYRLLGTVGTAGVILLVVMVLLGESLAPRLGAYARELRTTALLDEVDTSGEAAWFREGNRIIGLSRPDQDGEFDQGLVMFELEGDRALGQIASAESVAIEGANAWQMRGYAETNFGPEGTTAVKRARIEQDYGLSEDLLGLSVVREDLLDTPELVRYIDYLKANDLDASRYLAAYWQRIASGASVVLMSLLALPFVMGTLRSAGAGARMIIGLAIGLGYYVLVQVSAETGEVFALDPIVAAWAPTALLFAVTLVAVARLR